MKTEDLKQASQPKARRFHTYDELARELPESNQPCEIWDGELIMAPAPFFRHQEIVLSFYRALHAWVSHRALGKVVTAPVDMVLSARRVVQPDILFVSTERLSMIQEAVMGSADLVAEVISPGSRTRDRIEKRDLYEQHGIQEYWIIDPEAETIEVLRLDPGQQYRLVGRWRPGQEAASDLLPGFSVSVSELFVP
jgi:Uma2 family endonuclease